MKPVRYSIILLIISCNCLCITAQEEKVKQVKLSRFDLQSSFLISETGEMISSPQYVSKVYWFPVEVPSTVLTGLVANKVYPDPYIGLNNMLIPDASDEFNRTYNLDQYSHLPGLPNPWKRPYWYRTELDVPKEDKGRHFELIFKGINYRAGVWFNGHQVADSTQMAGMFAEYKLDVTSLVQPGGKNVLAVKIYPLDYPGLPAKEQLKALGDFFENGGPTGDIGKNVTMLCSVGWDWMPPVRDRNIGIWQPVFFRTSGGVTIEQPKLVTDLPRLPDTTVSEISLKIKLKNHLQSDENGKVMITITPETFEGKPIQFTKAVSLPESTEASIDFNADNTKELLITRPRLWWPNGYGKPELYRIKIQYAGTSGISDEVSFLFGIRSVGTKTTDVNGSLRRDFYVNGKRIHITGGAWVPDMMLNRDSLRYDYEFRLCRNSNVNLVRIWGGGVTPSDLFSMLQTGTVYWYGQISGSPEIPRVSLKAHPTGLLTEISSGRMSPAQYTG